MRSTAVILLILSILLPLCASAQVANGGFEEVAPAQAPPNPVWTLVGDLLPARWLWNVMFGGPVGVSADAHTGQHALSMGRGTIGAHLFADLRPVRTGDCFAVSAWVKGGSLDLACYEYAGEKWLRTAPNIVTLTGGDQWVQGGGYYHVTDPQITQVALVLIKSAPGGVLVDDVEMNPVQPAAATGEPITLENEGLKLALGSDGTCRSLFDKTRQEELLMGAGLPLFSAVIANWSLPASAVRLEGDLLQVTFGADQAKATIHVDRGPYHFGFRLKSWEPADLQSLTLTDLTVRKLATVGSSISATYDDRSALGLIALHYAGRQLLQPAADTATLRCIFPAQRGLDKAGCALFACPRDRLVPTIQEIEQTYGLPSPKIEGVWGKQSPLMKRSYFFIHDLSEANVEEVIAWGKRGRFGYIQILEDAWSNGGGTFAINEKNFPHGLDGLKAVVARLHAAGFKVGLHFLAAGMRGSDPIVSPKPDPGVCRDTQIPLAEAVDEKAAFLPTPTPPETFPKEDGGYMGQGSVVLVGEELLQYRTVKLDPPYGFVDCVRGIMGTTASAHPAGTPVVHLAKSYGLFLIDADSPLMDRVAENVARAFNYADCDGLYFDGSEGLQGDHDYYNARVQMAYASKINKRDVICQGSSFSPYTWHLVSRMASADGYGDIKYYLDQRSPAFEGWYDANLVPIDIGWYGMNPNIRPDDIEYIMSRAIGFKATVSISTGLNSLHDTPQAGEMMDLVGAWEELRLSGRVPDDLRARMREQRKEYTLTRQGEEYRLVPVEYSPWAVVPAEEKAPTELRLRNGRIRPAKLQLQLDCGLTVKPGAAYDTARPLELFEAELPGQEAQPLDTNLFNPTTHGNRATSQGVTQEITLVTDDVKEGRSACRFAATSILPSPSGWATFGRSFAPPLDLTDYAVIGLWVKGDGKGEALKLQLWDTQGKPQDQYLTINFTGWRFIELARPDPAPIDHSQVTRLHFYYNGMPAQTTSECLIDGVKVMSRATTMQNPEVLVGDRKLTFPVTLALGDRLICRGPGDCWVYRGGQPREAVPFSEELPAIDGEVTVATVAATHQLRLRAALQWPELATRLAR